MTSIVDKAAERAGVLAVKLIDAELRIARLELELADARKAQDGANALLCDAQAEIAELRECLEGKEQECILLGAALRKFEDALRPFAEAYRRGEVRRSDFLDFCRQGHFARAAELVPETPEP